MEELRDGVVLQTDNSDAPLPNGTKMMVNDISLNLNVDIEEQLEEFLIILNNRRSEISFNEHDLNLDEIDDVVSRHLINEVFTQNDALSPGNMTNADILTKISLTSNTTDKDMDVISISSTDSLNSGYNSSDFEFISESEAKRDGLIINFKADSEDPGEAISEISKNKTPPRLHVANSKIINEYIDRNSNKLKYRKLLPLINYGDRGYRTNHVIPERDNFLNLFQGINNSTLQNIHFFENKSIKTSVMNVEHDGIGFDKQFVGKPFVRDSSDDEFEKEAKGNIKKILSMYPRENNKRSRRH